MTYRSLKTQHPHTRRRHTLRMHLAAVVGLVATALLCVQCERRPLEVYYEKQTGIRVEIDWMDHFGHVPSGMTMLIYNDMDQLIRRIETNDVHSQTLYLEPGTYRMTTFSYTDHEYSSMRFENLNNHFQAAARANTLRDHTLQPWEQGTTYWWPPEDIGVAVDTIVITEEMVEEYVRFIDYRKRHEAHNDTALFVFYDIADPMTVTLYVKVKVKHRQSVQAVDASITGMADGFYLSRVYRTGVPNTLYLPDEDWHLYRTGNDIDSLGIMTIAIPSFGLPHGKEQLAERDSTDNVLTLHFTLTDGEQRDYSFNVGKTIEYINPTGRDAVIRNRQDLHDLRIEVDLPDTVVVPPKPPTRTGSGFDAWVDQWEYGGLIDFRM